MLQPLQIADVSKRYASEIAELREFLAKAGVAVDTAAAPVQVAAVLEADRTFRRDLTSHVWVALDACGGSIPIADLLAMLTVAAAGRGLAATADDAATHGLLRFLMKTKKSFAAGSDAPAGVKAVAVQGRDLFVRGAAAAPTSHAPMWSVLVWNEISRRAKVWVGAAAVLALLLISLWWRHRPVAEVRTASVVTANPASLPPAPANVAAKNESAQPVVSSVKVASVPKTVGGGRARLARVRPETLIAPSSKEATVEAEASVPRVTTSVPAPKTAPRKEPIRVAENAKAPRLAKKTGSAAARGTSEAPVHVSLGNPNVPAKSAAGIAAGANVVTTAHEGVVRPTSLGIMAGNVTYSPAPAYPSAASAARVEGEVKLEAEVDRDGNVVSTRIISGPPLLRAASEDAVQRWRYRPYLYEGKPIAMNAMVVMDFHLP